MYAAGQTFLTELPLLLDLASALPRIPGRYVKKQTVNLGAKRQGAIVPCQLRNEDTNVAKLWWQWLQGFAICFVVVVIGSHFEAALPKLTVILLLQGPQYKV